MATFTVTNTADDVNDGGSLRWALDQANNVSAGADTIVFAAGVTGAIQLTVDALQVTEALTIVGPGAAAVSVVAAANSEAVIANVGAATEVAISGLTFTGANAIAAVISYTGDLKLTGVTVSNNDAAFGAVTLLDGNLQLSNVTISGNRVGGGGLNAFTDGTVRVENSTISGNDSSAVGGGIGGVGFGSFSGAGTALLVNTTIANNIGNGAAGGLLVQNATAVVRDSTIAGNTDPLTAGVYATSANVTFENSIVFNPGAVDDVFSDFSVVAANYSLIGAFAACGCLGGLDGANNLIGVNPLLGPLANNGGLVLTMLPALNSPAINTGSYALGPTPALDARGQARVSGGQIDIGAVEIQFPGPGLSDGTSGSAPPPAPPPSKAPEINAAFVNLTRFQTYGFNPPLPATVTTPEGKTLPNPFLLEQAIVRALITKVDAGEISIAVARGLMIDMADATTSVATTGYQFFTGKLPTKAGLDYLVSSPENPTDLNDGFYAGTSLENRYINFAVNLGTAGEGRANFVAGYGALSLTDAAAKAYTEIFGTPPAGKIAEILTPDRVAYFTSLGGDALGAKAAMVGWLLAESAKSDIGPYAVMNENFLYDLADGTAAFGADLHVYLNAGPRHIGLIGEV